MVVSHLILKRALFLFTAAVMPASIPQAFTDEDATTSVFKPGIVYAQTGNQALKLDLWMPKDAKGPPLLVWVHGGAWRSGSRENPEVLPLLAKGWAIASVDYRLSPVARFPAQVHDIKAAIRYLRAHADDHGYAPNRIAIAGASAGGHLAALVGVTNGHAELEGKVGENLDADSSVRAIASLYGGSNLDTILAQSTPHGLSVRVPALKLLLGGTPDEQPALSRLASPVAHVDPKDPPLLLMHGDQDPQMPINQAHELEGAYKEHGVPCQFEVLHGAAHGGGAFYNERSIALLDSFLRKALEEGR